MERLLLAIAKRLRPELETADRVEQFEGLTNLFGILYAAPLALLGWVWLVAATDLALLQKEWPMLALLFSLVLLSDRLRFFILVDVQGFFVSAQGSLNILIVWTGALLFGPSALWLAVFESLDRFIGEWRDDASQAARWITLRNYLLRRASVIPTGLVVLALYEHWGGTYPLPGLSHDATLPALYATLLQSLLALLVHSPYVVYTAHRSAELVEGALSLVVFLRAAVVGMVLPALAIPFAILAAGLYAQNGLPVFLFFVAGLLLSSLLARQFSRAVERSQQRSRELERLEQLGRDIIAAPPDASTLPVLLREHVPGMFPSTGIEIRLFPNRTLVQWPDESISAPPSLWDWLQANPQACCLLPGDEQPWDGNPAAEALVVAPVMNSENMTPIGGICLTPRRDASEVGSLLPALQYLAAQIASTLHSAQVYAQTLAHQRVEQELALAGEIQARFLPDVLPKVPGWQLSATLEPARQTSGDFYDVIPLPNKRLGILIADVADKGTGAALLMALSRTLIRTYAVEHHARPDFTLRVANNRILSDIQVDMFVTVFYGVLDPATGTLTYCNAGHNPPYLLSARDGGGYKRLVRTGIPLGVFAGTTWEQKTLQLAGGDALLLYTDGVTEAQDRQERFFGEERLLATAQAHRGASAHEIQAALLAEVHAFVGDAPQFDDIAVMVLVREV